ncbi:MAG TPA: hypothetical protein VHF86_04825, partial [Xanthomonadaceae bacterium]|nr:hypothetical protein [Xanthomonadaceae bacterium]
QQASAHESGTRAPCKRLDEMIEPSGLRDGVVIEKYDEFPARPLRSVVACFYEASIFGAFDVNQAFYPRQYFRCAV